MLHEIKTLADLEKIENGLLGIQFARFLKQVNEDLIERPGADKSREIVLTCRFTPIADDCGALSEVRTELEMKCRAPAARTKEYSMGIRRDGLVFNDLSIDNVRQRTLDERDGNAS
ncbi:MAG: hypothetical protein AABZ12_00270 [Planctomycetota bacterium]